MDELLIVHGTVITMDPGRRVIDDGAVAIRGERIIEVGETGQMMGRRSAKRVIDAGDMVVMPGFIDAHAHAGHGLLKSIGCDNSEAWYDACEQIYTRGSTKAFWFAESSLSALERLQNGTTLGVSYLGGGESFNPIDDPKYGDGYCEAVAQIGIRAILAVGPGGPPFPRRYRRWEDGEPTHADVFHEQMLANCQKLIDRWHGAANGKIQLALAFPTPKPGQYTPGTPEFTDLVHRAQTTRALARDNGLLWTMDGHETGTVQFCHEHLDLLGADAFLSHCIDITETEIELCQRTGTTVVHNPSAVYSIMGRCPVPELLDAGATVVLGSDGTAPDRSYDMFRHMWQCMHYHRRHFRDPEIMPPGKLLEMVTIDAAEGLGLGDELGSLEAGKKADLIMVDMRKPHLYPAHMPVSRLVYYAKGSDVDTVIVNGEILMENRRIRGVDETAILDAAQQEMELALDRTGLRPQLELRNGFWGGSHY
jgi:cytosine/adenosine deaminase-related metal-dependent hydrolase